MLRYRLRTLLILLAILPPVLAAGWWGYNKLRPKSDEEQLMEIMSQMEETEQNA